jgi:FtsZ-binding cell division protein ZapB
MKPGKSEPGDQVPSQAGPGQRKQGGPPRWKQAQKEIDALKRRVALLEDEIQESRQLNKRLAEITDVVAEVLLPAEQRDEERLRALLGGYESAL